MKRNDTREGKGRKTRLASKAILKAEKESGCIVLDTETTLSGVPTTAWEYRLGNRSALEWVLDQYKEKMPKDPTVRGKFNTYRFADHKEKVYRSAFTRNHCQCSNRIYRQLNEESSPLGTCKRNVIRGPFPTRPILLVE